MYGAVYGQFSDLGLLCSVVYGAVYGVVYGTVCDAVYAMMSASSGPDPFSSAVYRTVRDPSPELTAHCTVHRTVHRTVYSSAHRADAFINVANPQCF